MSRPDIVRWATPPPPDPATEHIRAARLRREPWWGRVAAQLTMHPGEWAVVHEGEQRGRASWIAWAIARSGLAGFEPSGAFEATTRKDGDQWTTYARYTGGDDDA